MSSPSNTCIAHLLQPLALAMAALAATVAPPAEAGVVVQTVDFKTTGELSRRMPQPAGVVPYGRDLKDGVETAGQLTFGRFDASLGTLQGVTWELLNTSMGFDLLHQAHVISFDPLTFVTRLTLQGRVDQSGNVGGSSLLGTTGRSFNLAQVQTGACTVLGTVNLSLGCNLPLAAAMGAVDKIDADVSAFLGDGAFTEEFVQDLDWSDRIDLALFKLTGFPLAPALNTAQVVGRYFFAGQVRLTYNYEVTPPAGVPEPGTLWLVAGLLPLLALRRRRPS